MRRIFFSLFCLLLAGCSTPILLRGGVDDNSMSIDEITLDSRKTFRVGVLLPLTGQAAKYGQGMRNAALMALDDVKNPNLVLQFYDTKSTPAGSRIAIENALNQKAELILGPLMSSSLQAISETAEDADVPVVAFSTSEELLKPGIYTLGLLVDEQVSRIIGYAAAQGRRNFVLLIPDNSTGISVAKAAVKAAANNHVNIGKIAFYPPNTSDFSKILKEVTDYEARNRKVRNIRASLKKAAQSGDAAAARRLKRFEAYDTVDGVDFDAVLIPESGAKLKSAIAMFGYYDVSSPKVKFLGTSIWEGTVLSREAMAIGSWYPGLSRIYSSYFVKNYSAVFGEKPSSLYSLAYDAVALASSLSLKEKGDINEYITNKDGYVGINGVFRIYENGTNKHSLDIFAVRQDGDAVIDSAPKRFSEHEVINAAPDYFYIPPQIFGKDESVAQALIYGRVLPKSVDLLNQIE